MFSFFKFKKIKDLKKNKEKIDELKNSFSFNSFDEWKKWALQNDWVLDWSLWKTVWSKRNFQLPPEYNPNVFLTEENKKAVLKKQKQLSDFLWENFKKKKWKNGDFDFFGGFFSNSMHKEMRKEWFKNVFLWMQRDDESNQVEKSIDLILKNSYLFNCFEEDDFISILPFFSRLQAKKLVIYGVERSFSSVFFDRISDLFKGILIEEEWMSCFSNEVELDNEIIHKKDFKSKQFNDFNESFDFSNKLFPLCYAFRCYHLYGSVSYLNILKTFINKIKPAYCLNKKEKESFFYKNFISSLVKDSYKITKLDEPSLSDKVLYFFCNYDVFGRTRGMVDFDPDYNLDKNFLRKLWSNQLNFYFGKNNELPERIFNLPGEYWNDVFIKNNFLHDKEKLLIEFPLENNINTKIFQLNSFKSFTLTKELLKEECLNMEYDKNKVFLLNNFIFRFHEKNEISNHQKNMVRILEIEKEQVIDLFLNFIFFYYEEFKAKKIIIYYLRKFSKQNNYDFFLKTMENSENQMRKIVFFDKFGKEKNTNLWLKTIDGFIRLSNQINNDKYSDNVVLKKLEKINLINTLVVEETKSLSTNKKAERF